MRAHCLLLHLHLRALSLIVAVCSKLATFETGQSCFQNQPISEAASDEGQPDASAQQI
jgi:hypothetical protein